MSARGEKLTCFRVDAGSQASVRLLRVFSIHNQRYAVDVTVYIDINSQNQHVKLLILIDNDLHN